MELAKRKLSEYAKKDAGRLTERDFEIDSEVKRILPHNAQVCVSVDIVDGKLSINCTERSQGVSGVLAGIDKEPRTFSITSTKKESLVAVDWDPILGLFATAIKGPRIIRTK